MSEKEPKVYVGSGKKHPEYDLVNISVCLTDLPKDDIFSYKDKKYIKLTVGAKREVDKFGKSHYVCIDSFKPKEKEEAGSEIDTAIPEVPAGSTEQDSGTLPF